MTFVIEFRDVQAPVRACTLFEAQCLSNYAGQISRVKGNQVRKLQIQANQNEKFCHISSQT